jgi:hypothetical protein
MTAEIVEDLTTITSDVERCTLRSVLQASEAASSG